MNQLQDVSGEASLLEIGDNAFPDERRLRRGTEDNRVSCQERGDQGVDSDQVGVLDPTC